MTYRARLLQGRKESGLTQLQLAERLGVTRESVARYESGGQSITVDQLIRIAEQVGKPVAWFFEDAPSQPGAQPTLGDFGAPLPTPERYEAAHPAAGTEALPLQSASASVDPDILEQLKIAQDALDKMRAQLTKSQPKSKKAK